MEHSGNATKAAAPSPGWVDHVCVGPCTEFFGSHPQLHPWRSVIVLYLIVSAIVIVVLMYKSFVRRISVTPIAPIPPVDEIVVPKVPSPNKPEPVAAPRSPKARAAKKVAPKSVEQIEEVVAAAPRSPKSRGSRKSIAGGEAVATKAPSSSRRTATDPTSTTTSTGYVLYIITHTK